MIDIFIGLQFILLLIILLHDWVPIPPFNDIQALKSDEIEGSGPNKRITYTFINFLFVFIPLIITLNYKTAPRPLVPITIITLFYLILTIGTILSWWLPYLWGSSEAHKKKFAKFKNTHHFLPQRADNVVPNTLHVVLHVLIWVNFLIALGLFFTRGI